MIRNHFILITEPVPGTLGVNEEHTREQAIPETMRAHTHKQFHESPVHLQACFWRKPEAAEETHVERTDRD